MSANAISQRVPREALGALLNTEMTGVGNPVQVVFDHWVSDFSGDDETVSAPSPVVMLTSGGIARKQRGLGQQKYLSHMRIYIWLFVADAVGAEGWTDEDVDFAFDAIEKQLADVLADNQATASWNYIRYDNLETPGDEPRPTNVGGKAYVRQRIPVIVEVHDG